MQNITTQIKTSGTRLRDSGTAFATTTFQATNAFVDATVDATVTAYEQIRAALAEAGTELATEAKTAGLEASSALKSEAQSWQEFLNLPTPTLRLSAPDIQMPDAAQVVTQLRAAPRQVEGQVLRVVHKAIEDLGERVEARIEVLDQAAVVALPAAKKAKVKSQNAAKALSVPVRGYDALTAREATAVIQSATAAKVESILEYERANKGRATVVRAAEARLA
ncbi:MAG: hypothetical protein H6725_19910 [Sandaracinaceae bacterium]|nr:hypothetical protein [Sandaracinaceae bacterium]